MADSSIKRLPISVPIVNSNGTVRTEWARFFEQTMLNSGSNSTGPSVVKNAGTVQLTMSEGPTSSMPVASAGGIHLSTDEHCFYVVQGGVWRKFDEELTGDVTKSSGSNVTTLKTVNQAPGEYGSESQVPIVTVDAQGRVTSIILKNIVAKAFAKGLPGAIQFNNDFEIDGSTQIFYDKATGAFTFTDPEPTLKNLSPLENQGDILWFDGSNHAALGIGITGSHLVSSGSGPVWEQTDWGWSYGMIPQTLAFTGTCTEITISVQTLPNDNLTLQIDGIGTAVIDEICTVSFACSITSPLVVRALPNSCSRGNGWITLKTHHRLGVQA